MRGCAAGTDHDRTRAATELTQAREELYDLYGRLADRQPEWEHT